MEDVKMPVFRYIAADRNGQTIKGRFTVESVDAVTAQLDRQGLIPLKVQRLGTLSRPRMPGFGATDWRIEDKILFTQKLASLLKAGIPILTVLDLIARQTRSPRVAAALRHIADQIAAGMTVSDAMGQYPSLFDRVYLGAIQTGEATGRLDLVLDQISAYLEREMVTRRQVQQTVRYPIMVVIAMVIAAAIILKFVVPKFLMFYSHFGGTLPVPTRLLMAAARAVDRYWWAGFIVLAGALIWYWRWTKTAAGEQWRDRVLLRLPLVGVLFLKVAVCRFARLFGVMYSAGVPVTTALETVSIGVGNVIVGGEVAAMRHRLTTGESAAAAPPGAVMPELVYQMIGIGFESGEVERMMVEVARHYEQEVDYDVRRLADRLQPVMLALLASGVLMLALAVLLPMWNLISLFRQ